MFIPLASGKSSARISAAYLISFSLLMSACASTEKRADATVDPYEGFNRSMYSFNMSLDKYLFKPVSDGYQFVTPDFLEVGVSNFFNNLKGINVVLNDVLQGKFQQGAADGGRFLANTTLGVAGLVDVASEFGLKNNVEDFGQTLAVWGVEEGAYLVLPIMGPTTVRDGGGLIVDKAANPSTYVPGTGILEGISERANAESALKFIDEAALDPYVFTRESFLQYRRHLINDGKTDIASYDWDVEGGLENAEYPHAVGVKTVLATTETSSTAADSTSPAPQVNAVAATLTPHSDDMLQSFEQASMKMDQLHRQKGEWSF
ncbi:MlaA family lipoprotein [Methylomonas fluvii]|uniref:VacJ family lipoprotein n=1 Tax=Methylomonas fluvii TaxID=1854564 RepID=A0ABR9DBT6_9GAMM|nr:VacJ family lipoprotein [Methylomonas fluvii]MBD9360523.1 VacJ family lipoprotein [Methylomonas fluvii]CAD6873348.1 Outer-membrane-phospholipid-binding lipoprotein MlaA [Methylomonas fluvii]